MRGQACAQEAGPARLAQLCEHHWDGTLGQGFLGAVSQEKLFLVTPWGALDCLQAAALHPPANLPASVHKRPCRSREPFARSAEGNQQRTQPVSGYLWPACWDGPLNQGWLLCHTSGLLITAPRSVH